MTQFLHADNKDSDQTVDAQYLSRKVHFLTLYLI